MSEDTIAVKPRERTVLLQPLLRHTSVDSLRPADKVSNLRVLQSAPQQNRNIGNSVSSMSSVNINSITGLGKSYQNHSNFGRSVESMSVYSDGESLGEAIDSDVSTQTADEVPTLPSVKQLASKFNIASQESINDLDKIRKDVSMLLILQQQIGNKKMQSPAILNLTSVSLYFKSLLFISQSYFGRTLIYINSPLH